MKLNDLTEEKIYKAYLSDKAGRGYHSIKIERDEKEFEKEVTLKTVPGVLGKPGIGISIRRTK